MRVRDRLLSRRRSHRRWRAPPARHRSFWYAQAEGDFYSWARAHATDMDVEVFDPHVYASQVQGPDSLRVLKAASDDGMPDPFNYFGVATVSIGGQSVVVTRTGYTNELGWEFCTEQSHDADAIWAAITAAGEPFGLELIGLDAMHIRRIEAGILNAGSDFDHTMTPVDAGLSRFVDMDKADFIGKAALEAAPIRTRHSRSGLTISTTQRRDRSTRHPRHGRRHSGHDQVCRRQPRAR